MTVSEHDGVPIKGIEIKPVEANLFLAKSIVEKPIIFQNEIAHAIGTAIMKQYPDAVEVQETEDGINYKKFNVKFRIVRTVTLGHAQS